MSIKKARRTEVARSIRKRWQQRNYGTQLTHSTFSFLLPITDRPKASTSTGRTRTAVQVRPKTTTQTTTIAGENATNQGDAADHYCVNGTIRAESMDRPRSRSPPPFQLSDFPLVKMNIVTTLELIYFVNLFFAKIHHIFPIVPHHRVPQTEAQLTSFARGRAT